VDGIRSPQGKDPVQVRFLTVGTLGNAQGLHCIEDRDPLELPHEYHIAQLNLQIPYATAHLPREVLVFRVREVGWVVTTPMPMPHTYVSKKALNATVKILRFVTVSFINVFEITNNVLVSFSTVYEVTTIRFTNGSKFFIRVRDSCKTEKHRRGFFRI
jgi:hypothetical protein